MWDLPSQSKTSVATDTNWTPAKAAANTSVYSVPVWVFTTYFIPKNASACCNDPDLCGNEQCISLLSAAVPPVPLAATWDPTSISDPKTEKTEEFYCVIHQRWVENSQPRISRGKNEAKPKQRRD